MALSLAVLAVDERIQDGFLISINLNKSHCVGQDNKVKYFSPTGAARTVSLDLARISRSNINSLLYCNLDSI